MKFGRSRFSLDPLSGLGNPDSAAKLLAYCIYAALTANAFYIAYHLVIGGNLIQAPGSIYVAVLLFHAILLAAVKRGHIYPAARALILSAWVIITYQAWIVDGVRDTTLVFYVLIIMIAMLILSWRVAVMISMLSIAAVWGMALADRWGVRIEGYSSPLSVALQLTFVYVLVAVFAALILDSLRRVVRAVKVGENKFDKIFHATPAAVAITTLKEGRLLNANAAYWKLTGLDPGASIGRTTVELTLWANEAERQDFVHQLWERKSLYIPMNEFIGVHGERHSTNTFYELIDLGEEPTILTMHYDVTVQMKTEDALQKSNERFRRVFHKSPVAIVITSLDEGRVIDGNAAYWRLSGHDPKTSIGRTALELRQDLKPEQRQQFVQELLEKKSMQNPSYDFVNNRGEYIKTVAFYELIELDGKAAILSMFYDVTEQSQARDALRHSETRLRAMLKAVPDMVLEIKRDGTIAQFIPAANDELNFLPDDVVGKTVVQVLPSIAEQTDFAMQRALDSGQLHAFEFNVNVRGEHKTFEARLSPVASDLVLVMVRDISLNKWWEAEREKLIGELEQKNAELERFTYTVSHDLKSPIITIRGFLGFVYEDIKAGNMERLEKDMQRINEATEKMQQLLADLLELSRVGRINHKPTHISTNELIDEVVELLHGRLMMGKVEVCVEANLPPIYGDQPRVFEIFQNLIDNAAKFMGEQPNPQIDIGVNGELDGNPVFYVRDNGIGIPLQFRDRIFGLFDKLDPLSEGTGIGLALVKRIVEFHGGKIWVEGESGHGATFFFSLPRSKSGRSSG
jgi:PAS domain S-box-containing protein